MHRIDRNFFIDLSDQTVICRQCGQKCHMLNLDTIHAYVCITEICPITDEMQHDLAANTWRTVPISEIWGDRENQEIALRTFLKSADFELPAETVTAE